jgi:hypothetical protein
MTVVSLISLTLRLMNARGRERRRIDPAYERSYRIRTQYDRRAIGCNEQGLQHLGRYNDGRRPNSIRSFAAQSTRIGRWWARSVRRRGMGSYIRISNVVLANIPMNSKGAPILAGSNSS